jgi:hypothetical protein
MFRMNDLRICRALLALLTAALWGCAAAPQRTEATDSCMRTSLIKGTATLGAFWAEVRAWDEKRFEAECTATPATPGLLAEQRLRLAMAYGAPNNPRRDSGRAVELLRGVDPADPLAGWARLQNSLLGELEQVEQPLRNLRLQLAEVTRQSALESVRADAESKRADTEARRASSESRRANAADEKARDAERRLVEANQRINEIGLRFSDVARRLDALKSVESQMGRKGRITKNLVQEP